MSKIEMKAGTVSLTIELNDSETAQALLAALPIHAKANTWGEEIYFPIPVNHAEENPTPNVAVGDVAYWPVGKAFCVFFGRTPMSRSDQPVPASAVNPLGKVLGDARQLKAVKNGEKVELLAAK